MFTLVASDRNCTHTQLVLTHNDVQVLESVLRVPPLPGQELDLQTQHLVLCRSEVACADLRGPCTNLLRFDCGT